MKIGEKIKKYRLEKGLSQEKLANAIGISTRALINYEKGIRTPQLEVKLKINELMGEDIFEVDYSYNKSNTTPLIDKNLGENIKNARKQKGLSQEQLSELTGIPRISLGRYERGETSQSFEVLKRIANTLECTVANLIGEVNGYSNCNITEFTNEELIEELKRRLVE